MIFVGWVALADVVRPPVGCAGSQSPLWVGAPH
jgi:hypothetical protein